MFRTICIVLVTLCLLGAVGALVGAGYYGYQEYDLVPGKIVYTTFTGCPAYLGAALIGPKGEYASMLSAQDAADFLYVDVPGSAGAYSSWFRPGGGVGSAFDAGTQASQSAYPWSSLTCVVDQDCLIKPHMACGQLDAVWGGKDPKTGLQKTYADSGGRAAWSDTLASAQCGAVSNDPTLDGNWLTCSFTDATQNHGLCMISAGTTNKTPGNANPYVCYNSRCVGAAGAPGSGTPNLVTACAKTSDCAGLAQSSGSSLTFACNVGVGYCQPDNGETAMIMAPWRAEGTITDVNADGTVNVQWMRVQLQWPNKGPQLKWFPSGSSWDYTDGVFIADSDDDFKLDDTTAKGSRPASLFAVLGGAQAAIHMASLASSLTSASVTSDAFSFLRDPWGLPTLQYDNQSSMTAWGSLLGEVARASAVGGSLDDADNTAWSLAGQNTAGAAGSGLPGWMGALFPGQTVGGLPSLGQANGNTSLSAWNLKSTLPKKGLYTIPKYTIEHTDPKGNSGLTSVLLGSMSAYRTMYMADRPPHLQFPETKWT